MEPLKLADCDEDIASETIQKYLSQANKGMAVDRSFEQEFRADDGWKTIQSVSGKAVVALQKSLSDLGFLSPGYQEGIFGYQTEAAVRICQEYLRTVGGMPQVGGADGIYGPNTARVLKDWTGKGHAFDWADDEESSEAEAILRLLFTWKMHCSKKMPAYARSVSVFGKSCDTLDLKDWTFAPGNIHLIGIRNEEGNPHDTQEDNDLFLLVIRGKVFKFWGSTTANSTFVSSSQSSPFLVEGQHRFRIGWHKITDKSKIYRALVPTHEGVLVYRDRNKNYALEQEEIQAGLTGPNPTIHVHWSGLGISNWSAGCQVIAGRSYENPEGEIINYSGMAARTYSDLGPGRTRGAYQIMLDLIQISSPQPEVLFTLISLDDFNSLAKHANGISWHIDQVLERLKK